MQTRGRGVGGAYFIVCECNLGYIVQTGITQILPKRA